MSGNRTDYAGGSRPKPGKPRVGLPTQVITDTELVIDVPQRTEIFSLTSLAPYGTPHPTSPDHTLQYQYPFQANDNEFYVRQIYRKASGAPLEGGTVNVGTWGAIGTTETQRVPPGTQPETGLGVIESTVTSPDGQTSSITTVTVDWPTLTEKSINARGDVETTTLSKVSPSASLPSDSLLTTRIEQEAETKDRSTQSVSTVTEYSTLTTKEVGSPQLARFAKDGVVISTSDIVSPSASPDTGTGIISSTVRQTSKTKAEKVTQSVDEFVNLTGTQAYVDRTVGIVTETASKSAQSADTGLLVAESQVQSYADGSSIKRTVAVESHPELTGYQWDDDVQASVQIKEQVVHPSTVVPAANTEYRIINKDKSLKRVIVPPTSALVAFMYSYPSSASLQIPDVLQGITVHWSKDSAEGSSANDWGGNASGTSGSLSGSESSDARSSGSLIPELSLDIKQYWARNLPTTIRCFYISLENLSEANILSRIGAMRWPIFRPEAHTIVLKGAKVSVQARTQINAAMSWGDSRWANDKSIGGGDSYDLSPFLRTQVIPPTIHGTINLSGGTSDTLKVEADAESEWSGYASWFDISKSVHAEKEISASVSPTTLAATSPSAVPTSGRYMINCQVRPYKYGYFMVIAETFEADNLA